MCNSKQRRVAILCYHRILDSNTDFNMTCVTQENFVSHIKYIKDNYDILSLNSSIEEWFKGKRDAVIITFDDGYYDFFSNALPILEREQVPATLFISTSNIDKCAKNWTDVLCEIYSPKEYHELFILKDDIFGNVWQTRTMKERDVLYNDLRNIIMLANKSKRDSILNQLKKWLGVSNNLNESRTMLTKQEIYLLSKSKFVQIGAHTVNHVPLGFLTEREKKEEVSESKIFLEEIIGKEVNLFAYPFGQTVHIDKTKEVLIASGYEKAVTTIEGLVSIQNDRMLLPRFNIRNYCIEDFRLKMDFVFPKKIEKHLKENEWMNINNSYSYVRFISFFDIDHSLEVQPPGIVIWGCGHWATILYRHLCSMGLKKFIIGFSDSNDKLWGTNKEGVPVLNGAEAENIKTEALFLIMSTYDIEIAKDLIGRGYNKIYVINRK